MRLGFAGLLLIFSAACAENDAPDPTLLGQLNGLDGVRAEEWFPPDGFDAPTGYRFFDLHVTVALDHEHPDGGKFEIYAALMHKDVDAPLVVHSGGYDVAFGRYLTEPARLLAANQVSL